MLIIDRNTAEWKMAEYNKPNQQYVYMMLHGDEIKIGLNNRELGKLWSRYKTYHASFKAYIVRVDDSSVVEKAIHTALKTRGLHITHELFKNCIETREVFKRIAQMFDKDDVQDLKHIGSVARPYHNNNQNTTREAERREENHAEKLAKIEADKYKKEMERCEMERREDEEKAQIREAEEKAAEWGRMRERNIRDEERRRRHEETERQIQRLMDERREAEEEDDRREAELREQEKKAKRREEERRREAEKRAKRREDYENVSFEPTSFVKLSREAEESHNRKSKEDENYKRYISKPDELKKQLDKSLEKLNKYGENFERKTRSNIRF